MTLSGTLTPTATPTSSLTTTATPSDSITSSAAATRSHTTTPSVTPPPAGSPSATPLCAASDFRPLPRTDLVGALVGASLAPAAPVLVPDEPACRQACCLAPACDGYSFDTNALFFHSQSTCHLYVNVTQLVPNSGYTGGLR